MPKPLKRLRKKSLTKDSDDGSGDGTEEILKTCMQRGRKLCRGVDDIFLKNSTVALTRFGHELFPGFNICAQPVERWSELQDYPNCTVSVPHPVYVAAKRCESIDHCHRRTLERQSYIKRLNFARTCYNTAMRKNNTLHVEQKNDVYHASLFDFAERLESNPDPYFNGCYDYFYTGGNLCVLSEGKNVVHVGGDTLQDLHLSRFSNKRDLTTVQMRPLHYRTALKNSEIMQVIAFLTNRENHRNCFVTRQRNCVTIYANHKTEKLKALMQYSNASTPFISLAQSAGDVNKFILTNMKQHVRLFDLNSSQAASCNFYEVKSEIKVQWNTVKPWREHTYFYANKKDLYLMDTRTSPTEWYNTKCTLGPGEFFCDEIASLAVGEFKKQIYVGTNHRLYNLDTRCWARTFDGSSTICRWLHQLEYPPLLMDNFRRNSNEYVALSSPFPGDMCICELTRTGRVVENSSENYTGAPKYKYKSLSLPYQPPTMREAYNNARLHGKCLRPQAYLQQRILCCTTGLAFYENTMSKYGQTLLLSSNSNGDVFAHQLSERETQEHEPRTSSHTDEVMERYEELICNQLLQPNLNYTEVLPTKVMSKVFRCGILDSADAVKDLDDAKKSNPPLTNPKKFGQCHQFIQTLHSYKDELAQDILSVWDIDCEEQTQVKTSDLKKLIRVNPDSETMVKDWLRNRNELNVNNSTEDRKTCNNTFRPSVSDFK